MNDTLMKYSKDILKCTHDLLGQPVLSYDPPFVTVAFSGAPWASDYKRFMQAGWEVHGHVGRSELPAHMHQMQIVEVTFKRTDPSAVVPVLA